MRSNAPGKTRFGYIDLMETLGIFFVIIYHSQIISADFLHAPSAVTFANYMATPILSTCVPMFLFANGFLLIGQELDIKKHVFKILKLIVLTVVWGLINIVCMMAIHGEWMSVKEIFKALWGWKHGWIHHMWYMGALICVYLFFPLIKAAFDHHKKAFYFFVVVCFILTFGNKLLCMVATIIWHFLFGGNTYVSLNFFNMFNPFRNLYGFAFAYFLLGCCMRGRLENTDAWMKKNKVINPVTLLAIIVLSCLLSGAWGVFCSHLTGQIWDNVMDSYDSIFTIICTIAIYLLFFRYSSRGNVFDRFVRAVSSNTLGIYLMHEIFLHLFKALGIGSLPFMSYFPAIVLYSFLVMCLCLGISLLLGKIPVIRNLTGWSPHK